MIESKTMMKPSGKELQGSILVIGAGMSGITVALEASEAGYNVILLEKDAYLGGRVLRMHQYFPKMCPPACGLEINFKRLKNSPRVQIITQAEVTGIAGTAGNYTIKVHLKPRYVNENCTVCGDCLKVCPVERDNDFNYLMDHNKAIFLPHPMAYPYRLVIDEKVCLGEEDCAECVKVCKYNAIDLKMQECDLTLKVGAVVWATGWQPYDAHKIDNLSFGKAKNVITNVMMERLAAPNGPTQGKILRPSDQQPPKQVVFVQCAGSRDEKHLNYCSAVCCLASLKQSLYIRETLPETEVRIFYIDLRAPGRLEDFLNRVKGDSRVILTKGKVAKIEEDRATKNLFVEAEDVAELQKLKVEADLVVLATGIEATVPTGLGLPLDEFGFIRSNGSCYVSHQNERNILAAGCVKRPMEVGASIQDATGIALKAIQHGHNVHTE